MVQRQYIYINLYHKDRRNTPIWKFSQCWKVKSKFVNCNWNHHFHNWLTGSFCCECHAVISPRWGVQTESPPHSPWDCEPWPCNVQAGDPGLKESWKEERGRWRQNCPSRMSGAAAHSQGLGRSGEKLFIPWQPLHQCKIIFWYQNVSLWEKFSKTP